MPPKRGKRKREDDESSTTGEALPIEAVVVATVSETPEPASLGHSMSRRSSRTKQIKKSKKKDTDKQERRAKASAKAAKAKSKAKAKAKETEAEEEDDEDIEQEVEESKAEAEEAKAAAAGVDIVADMTAEDLNQFSMQQLKDWCTAQGFYAAGKKSVIVKRIVLYFESGKVPRAPKRKTRKKLEGWEKPMQWEKDKSRREFWREYHGR